MSKKTKYWQCLWLLILCISYCGCSDSQSSKKILQSNEITVVKGENSSINQVKIPDSTDTFTPNPHFENYLTGTPIFGKNFVIALEYPKGEKRHPLKNKQFLFRIKGSIESKTGDAPTNFKLRLFTNQIADFRNNKAREEWAMEFDKTGNFYQFKMGNILMNIDVGIYYYIIEKEGEIEPYFVGKISLL
ncbi:MAG: hypothetical protein ACI9XO_001431 [Paraglaciecola sp.]|jgi:hypothetical protein